MIPISGSSVSNRKQGACKFLTSLTHVPHHRIEVITCPHRNHYEVDTIQAAYHPGLYLGSLSSSLSVFHNCMY
ncbi:hypothetical protein BCP12_097 [Bacillus phage BCP12]|uniref:Uncharacterized protein n=1 Tax=Bacillus phage BCP12 TaxID=1913122 RepID=A0A2S0CS45_9CAUD|nr:hypothetical protein BCP12_097 [Bacillus phage BCP12]